MQRTEREQRRVVTDSVLLVGVDVALGLNHACCMTVRGESTKTFTFANTREGFDLFWETAMAAKMRFGCERIMVGYESTGPYAEPLVHYLCNKPVTVVQVNPLHTKRVKELSDNSPGKTDG